ncbi:hypothetical protein LOK49_LG08G01530 [Camellia lanceoleosa]|uniref:Uncharacterized protein n=1 Tax=Camellia lanceoleosa TaxID=1840588 RepID=A0ACC0GNU8_9ERIC|nr:hypothetical protein LOK49_LG08G01530 [Camellia lanceoleosa]
MGQVQSDVADSPPPPPHQSERLSSSSPETNQPASMESLIAEAAAYGNDENASLDAKAQKALECPCISDLRKGPCGTQFSEAFLCFLKSTSEEKGSDCVHPFVALQSCIKANPNAFSKDVLDDDENDVKKDENEVKKEVEATQEYRVLPPLWSVESQKPKPKL